MQWFRVHVRAVAAATLVALATLGAASSFAHATECHDDECASAILPHDPAAHSVGSGTQESGHGPLHCVLCHWTRTTRPTPGSIVLPVRPATDSVGLHADSAPVPSRTRAAQPPLRSPPLA